MLAIVRVRGKFDILCLPVRVPYQPKVMEDE